MKCTFCSKDIEKGTGKMSILNTGRILSFCSSKCEKNVKMGRDSRNFKWAQQKNQ